MFIIFLRNISASHIFDYHVALAENIHEIEKIELKLN